MLLAMGFGKASGRGSGSGSGRGHGYGYGRGFGQGKGGFSGYSCVKFVFFGFNVFFWLLGCAILGVGIWLQVSRGPYATLSPNFSFFSATALCIAAGILILIVGFFGCCGSIMESKCLLMTYFVVIVVIFILEVVGCVLAFIYAGQIEEVIGQELYVGIREQYPAQSETSQYKNDFKNVWSAVQGKIFKCCGVYNHTDWYRIKAWPNENKVPRECCRNNNSCHEIDTPDDYFSHGCLLQMKSMFKNHAYILGIVGICLGVIQILGLVASMALFCCLRQDKYYDD